MLRIMVQPPAICSHIISYSTAERKRFAAARLIKRHTGYKMNRQPSNITVVKSAIALLSEYFKIYYAKVLRFWSESFIVFFNLQQSPLLSQPDKLKEDNDMSDNQSFVTVGDWVTGHSINDELFTGFVEAVNVKLNTVKVYVTESDHKNTIGKTIETFQSKIKYFPPVKEQSRAHLLNLIDLSLMSGDKDWFLHLTENLKVLDELEAASDSQYIPH
jgi:IDEAL domain